MRLAGDDVPLSRCATLTKIAPNRPAHQHATPHTGSMKSREERTENARKLREYNKKLKDDAVRRGGFFCVSKMMDKVISKVKSRANDRRRATQWQKEHPDKANKKAREWAHNHAEQVADKQRRYKEENREMLNEKERLKYHSDEAFRIRSCVRARLRHFLKTVGYVKEDSTFELVGCSPEELQEHLEQQLPLGANLEDYQIDHIFPLAMYKKHEMWKMTHWRNLQPLLPSVNNSKHNNVPSMQEKNKVPKEYWPECMNDYKD